MNFISIYHALFIFPWLCLYQPPPHLLKTAEYSRFPITQCGFSKINVEFYLLLLQFLYNPFHLITNSRVQINTVHHIICMPCSLLLFLTCSRYVHCNRWGRVQLQHTSLQRVYSPVVQNNIAICLTCNNYNNIIILVNTGQCTVCSQTNTRMLVQLLPCCSFCDTNPQSSSNKSLTKFHILI